MVLPILDEEETLPELHRRLDAVLGGMDVRAEMVFVDDGSTDGSADWLRRRAAEDPRVRLLRLSRNFGHQAAILAGLEAARGDAVVIMDGDLQDPPEVLPDLVDAWRRGGDVVYAVRDGHLGDGRLKRTLASIFYRVFRAATSIDAPLDAGDFRLLDRRVVDELTAMGETHLFLRGLTRWLGFRQVSVSYRREARYGGAPKYSTWRSLRLALDGLTSFTAAPMGWMMGIGSAVATIGFLYAAYYVLLKLLVQPESLVPGWTTLLAAILFLGGLQLFCLGLIGLYIGRIFEEVKKRPRYLVQETVDGSGDG